MRRPTPLLMSDAPDSDDEPLFCEDDDFAGATKAFFDGLREQQRKAARHRHQARDRKGALVARGGRAPAQAGRRGHWTRPVGRLCRPLPWAQHGDASHIATATCASLASFRAPTRTAKAARTSAARAARSCAGTSAPSAEPTAPRLRSPRRSVRASSPIRTEALRSHSDVPCNGVTQVPERRSAVSGARDRQLRRAALRDRARASQEGRCAAGYVHYSTVRCVRKGTVNIK